MTKPLGKFFVLKTQGEDLVLSVLGSPLPDGRFLSKQPYSFL